MHLREGQRLEIQSGLTLDCLAIMATGSLTQVGQVSVVEMPGNTMPFTHYLSYELLEERISEFIYPAIFLPINSSTLSPTYPSIHLPTHPCIYLHTHPPIYHAPTTCPSLFPSTHPQIHPSIHPPIYLLINLPVLLPPYRPTHLPTHHISTYLSIHSPPIHPPTHSRTPTHPSILYSI